MNPYIHATDLVNLLRCQRLAWTVHDHRESGMPYSNLICPFSSLYLEWLGLQDLPCGQVGDSAAHSLELLEKHGGGYSLRLEYNGCRTKIPILVRNGTRQKITGSGSEPESTYKAIYPYLTVFPKEQEALLMAINRQIAKKLGIEITEHEVVYLNRDYIRQDQLDLDGLLLKSSHLFKRAGVPFDKTIDEMLDHEDAKLDLDGLIEKARVNLFAECPREARRNKYCTAPRRCSFYEQCFNEDELPDNHSAFLFSGRGKDKLDTRLGDIPPEYFDGHPMQYAQIQADRHGGQFADLHAIQGWLNQLQKPVIFLDFEWDTFSIPPYRNMRPFDVLCFQYSMHVWDGKKLEHYNFFSGGDCREAFISSLVANVPKEGSIIVYNMEGAEKLRLIQLADQFPEYREDLEAIWSRMVDLSVLFENGSFYDIRQRGRFSLKSVLPLFCDDNGYKHLEVQDGLQAIFAYRKYEACSDPVQKEQIAHNISSYCEMDTMAEVLLLEGLQKLCQKEI